MSILSTTQETDSVDNAAAPPGASATTVLRRIRTVVPAGGPHPLVAEQLLELMPVAVCICDGRGRPTFRNACATALWRGPATETWTCDWLVGRGGDGAPIDGDANPVGRALHDGAACRDLEVVLRRRDGSEFDASVTVEPMRDEAGRITGAICVVVDITADKRRARHQSLMGRLTAELAAAHDEKELIRITTALVGECLGAERCGFVENEADSGTVRVIPGWIRTPLPSLAGRHELQALGDAEWQRAVASRRMAIGDVTTDPHTAAFAESYLRLGVRAYAGAPFMREGRWVASLTVTTNAPQAWTEDDLLVLEAAVARVWPLIERARAYTFLQLIAANAPVVLAYVDRDNRIQFANRAFAERWGLEPAAVVGRGAEDLLGSEALAMIRPHCDAVLAGRPVEFEMDLPYAGIGRRYIRASFAPDLGSDGVVRGYLMAVADLTERRAIEQAMRQSEERFRTLAQHAPVGIFQTDPQGNCVFVNAQWCRMAAMPPEDAVGQGWARAVHPDDRERVVGGWRAALGTHERFALEHRLLRRDGVVIWVETGAVEFRDDAGLLLGHIGTVADITERKSGEFALRESEKRFRLLASRAPVGIFMTNPQGETVYVNPAWCNTAGLTPEQAQGFGWTHAVHPDDRDQLLANWHEAVARGTSAKAEYRFCRPDGTITWVHGTAVQLRDANGRLTGYIGTIADFTERKQAELALRESEERFRLLADNIAQFAWIVDAAGNWVWVNRRFLEYTGTTLEAMRHGQAVELHHPDHQARVLEKFERHLAGGEPWEDSFPLRGCDGSYRWFLSRAVPIRDATGRITRWFGTNTDITEWRGAQEMLRKAREELLVHAGDLERVVAARTASLREAIVQMEEFSYSVSHDLRAPLRAMNGYAEALMEDYGPRLDDTARDYLRRIRRSSERMEKLTHDVLTYSRIARAEVTFAPVELAPLVRDLVGQYAELQPGTSDLVLEEPLHRVLGHELSVGQCLGNLLTNAAKFVAPGVRPRIRISTTERDGLVRVWVADNGIGIPPAQQKNLFQMFERVPTPRPYEGTGIGLAIVRKAMEKMGGRYGLESDGATGSRFWIELPGA